MNGSLYLIPTPIGEQSEISPQVKMAVLELRHFIVESEKEARRFLSKCGYDLKNHYPEFYILNEHTRSAEITSLLEPLRNGKNMGLMSDAGLPAVADPGSIVVSECHKSGILVKPLPGPSSLMYALMCSGLNGQQFHFHGYIPARNPERTQKLKRMDQDCRQSGTTQLFIETPYRNKAVLEDILKVVHPETLLCIAMGMDTANCKVLSKPVHSWKQVELGDEKLPAVFMLGQRA